METYLTWWERGSRVAMTPGTAYYLTLSQLNRLAPEARQGYEDGYAAGWHANAEVL